MNNIIKMFNKTISPKKKKKISKYKINDSIVYKFFIIKTKENVKIGILFPTLLEKRKRKKRDRKPY